MSKFHIEDDNEPMEREADLRDWFKKEKWIDLRRPKKDGGYEACGRSDTSKGKKPVCTPANKAKTIDKKERTQRLKEKAKKEKMKEIIKDKLKKILNQLIRYLYFKWIKKK